jgi:SAM-dependent methyltransferase
VSVHTWRSCTFVTPSMPEMVCRTLSGETVTGALSQAVLERGPSVAGVDPSHAFVRHAARAFAKEPRATFETGDAQRLRFPDASFDAVVSGLVLNFVPDPARAVKEMTRVAKPGAPVAAYVWDYAGKMEMLRHFWDAAIELEPRAKPLDEGARFPICNAPALSALFNRVGLRDVETTAIDQPTVFAGFDDYWNPFMGGVGPAPAYAMSLPDKPREQLRETIRAKLPKSRDGSIHLVARAWAVRGVK